MTTPQPTIEDLKRVMLTHLINLPKMMSARATAFFSLLFGYYMTLPLDRQQELLSHLPVSPWALSFIAALIVYLCQIWPQASLIKASPAPAPVELPVLTDVVLPLDGEAVLAALRLRYPDLSDRSIDSLRAIAKAIPYQPPPTKGTSP